MKSETVPLRKLPVAGMLSLLLLAGCGGGNQTTSSGGPNSVPTISSIAPSCAPAGEPVQLTVAGTNFVASSVVRWNGTDLPTTSNGSI
jgi:hypothetical protein